MNEFAGVMKVIRFGVGGTDGTQALNDWLAANPQYYIIDIQTHLYASQINYVVFYREV